jgi:Domain of unknown function (DUF4326)
MALTTVVHCKRSPHDVYIGRPSIWGNPFPMKCEAEHATFEDNRQTAHL